MATNGIDFVIGGKDNASGAMSAVEQSLGSIESALGGMSNQAVETEKFMDKLLDQQIEMNRIFEKTAAGTKQVSSGMKASSTDIKTRTAEEKKSIISAKSLTIALTGLAAAYAIIKASIAVLGGLDKINSAYALQTKNVKDLNSALAARGQSSQSKPMQDFAASLQKLTGVGDEVTIGLMQQAIAMGYATDAADDATKAAVGLADVTGKTAEQSLGDMKEALQGNFEAFHGLNPQIMYMRTNQEKLAAVFAIANQGLKQQSQNMLTVEGSGRRVDGAFGDLLESVGAIIAPFRVLINAGIQKLSESLQTVLAPAVEYANEMLANIGPIIDWVKEKVVQGINIIIGAFTFLEVIVTNLGSVWELISLSTELAMGKIVGWVRWAFLDVIPKLIEWDMENFTKVLETGFNLAYTIVSNHVTKIVDALAAMWKYIASGGQTDLLAELGAISARSYLDGFESTIGALPEIAGRKLTEREKELAEKMGQIGANLGQQFSDKMKERMIGIGDTVGSELQSASDQFNLQGRKAVLMQGINAQESRLLTRGPGSIMTIAQATEQITKRLDILLGKPGLQNDDAATIAAIKEKKEKEIKLVPVQ